jgi:hypothetical protein
MAKSKYATALFEVMNRQKSAAAAAAAAANGRTGSLGGDAGSSSPRWWFKSRNGSDVKTIAPGEMLSASSLTAAAEPASMRSSSYAATMVPPLASSIDVPQVNPGAPAPRVQPVAVSVDPDRQQISLRLSYTSALIGGFGLFILLGVAVLIGKSLSRGPSTAIANTSTQVLRQSPPTPGVMNVPRRGSNAGAAAEVANDAIEGAVARQTVAPSSTGTRVPQPAYSEPRPPSTFFTDDPHRQNGLNYAIIQSYPNRETAEKAVEFLTKHGIPCTVESRLPNWKLAWADGCAVVGIRGFAKVTNNPSLDAYRKSIMDVSAKFTSNRGGFTAFSPTMYQWKKSN